MTTSHRNTSKRNGTIIIMTKQRKLEIVEKGFYFTFDICEAKFIQFFDFMRFYSMGLPGRLVH